MKVNESYRITMYNNNNNDVYFPLTLYSPVILYIIY